MIQQVHRRFLTTIIMYAVYFLGILGLLIYGYIATGGSNWVTTLAFVFFVVTIFVTSIVSDRINYFTNLSYLYRIYENQGDPLPIVKIHDPEKRAAYLQKEGYKTHRKDASHTLYYRITDDHVKQLFSMHMLEVVVVLNNEETEFYLDVVNDEINELKDKLLQEKQKVNRLFITQIKEIAELDDNTKKQLSEVIFIRTKNNIISTINIGILDRKLAVLEYSDTYSPSLYYTYHIEQIKKML